jgi:hypothetical protein
MLIDNFEKLAKKYTDYICDDICSNIIKNNNCEIASKNKMLICESEKSPNLAKIYKCDKCNYICSKQSDLNKHLTTRKHQMLINANVGEKFIKEEFYYCICGKIYKHIPSLSRHKKKCNINITENNNDIDNTDNEKCIYNTIDSNIPKKEEIIDVLVKENSEFKALLMEQNKLIIEMMKNNQINNINQNTINQTNCNNKTFNLQVFLNEKCKDAMNISEFIENISLQLSDLESIGRLGYVEGVSNIIIKNLNALEVEKRPMHCTDKKREIMYVKDDDEWQKEQDDKKRIKSVISNIISKNLELLTEYENKYPECMNPESKKSDEYNKIIMETMGGGMNLGEKNKEKVISKIAKNVVIDKE